LAKNNLFRQRSFLRSYFYRIRVSLDLITHDF
jgi:hypothetical protein